MASKLVSGSISRRTSPRLNVNPRLPPVNFSNGRKAPIRRGQTSNLGHPIMNSQRNRDLDESFNGLDEMDDDEIEVNEGLIIVHCPNSRIVLLLISLFSVFLFSQILIII
ncbi:hypothetical protein ACJIZ3_019632 [Penstemon smallii]|uniref:Uncharacterized protein n=1 Tax=Penstemon smallii TaxID=265156 RepID=A0ABD3T2P5_9LAMI